MQLKGKKGVILGVANARSIAWAVAQKFHEEGAKFTITYQNDRIGRVVKNLATKLNHTPTFACDVNSDEQINALFEHIKNEYGSIDFLVHSIAYAPPKDLKGHFYEVSREGFRETLEVSAFSLTALAQRAVPLMKNGGSIITMTSMGGWRIVPNYHVMGIAKSALESSLRYLAADLGTKNIRVNGISSGPIRTVSAKGIRKFASMLKTHKERSPLRRTSKASDTAQAAVFLSSDQSTNITGEVLFVDSGYHVIGI